MRTSCSTRAGRAYNGAMNPRATRSRFRSWALLPLGFAVWMLAGVRSDPRAQTTPAEPAACDLTTTSRIVSVGDVHGAFDRFEAILREAGLIDARGAWIGGAAILVQTGDLLDRGPDSRRAMDLVRRLEGEAARAGGQVHALLGNHEVMRIAGDVRYTSAAEYDAFRSDNAEALRERLYEQQAAEKSAQAASTGATFDAEAFRKTFLAATPLGAAEMQQAFAESGEYGAWLRHHDAMVRINGMLFVHAGPNAAFAAAGCEATNRQARADLKTMKLSDPGVKQTLLWISGGPVWYRGLVADPPTPAAADEVTAVLNALGASRIVVGHTTSPSRRIRSLYGGRVLETDTGMLGGDFFRDGVPSALEIANGVLTAIYLGSREVLSGS
jgi:hypothetical protein